MTTPPQGTRPCPYCNAQVYDNAQYCYNCGYQFPDQVAQAPQGQPVPSSKPRRGQVNFKILIPIAILAFALCICVGGGAYFFRDQIMAYFQPDKDRALSIDPRGADGSVSGKYGYPAEFGDQRVNFSVTADGVATYRIEGAPVSETLSVALSDEQTTVLTWAGYTLTGVGALTGEQAAALDSLMNSDLVHGLSMIPLDLACQVEGTIDDKQLAALLVPLQMRFKYLVSDRQAEASRLISLSGCDYGSTDPNNTGKFVTIQLSPATPVPVVFGYFPFDEKGAIEPPVSQVPGSEIACLGSSPLITADGLIPFSPMGRNPETILGRQVNVKGPCGSMCRGACGVGCTLNNCTLTTELRCEKNAAGQNTGNEIRHLVYTCGIHQGCIKHDNCYDHCNQFFGCGTWEAVVCRHGQTPIVPAKYIELGYCDQKAIQEYGYTNSIQWARGKGTHETTDVFEYTDEAYGSHLVVDKCPSAEVLFTISPDVVKGGELHDTHQFLLQVSGLTTSTQTIRFEWHFGDQGSLEYPASGEKTIDLSAPSAELTIVHKYAAPGNYELKVDLYDHTYARNTYLRTQTANVEILPDEFRVNIEPADQTGIAGQPVSFNATVNNPGEYRYDWTFDGVKQENIGLSVSHTFAAQSPGVYVKVEVFDKDGKLLGSDEDSVVIYPPPTPTTEDDDGEDPDQPPGATLTELASSPVSPYVDDDVQFWVYGDNWPANPAFDWDFGEPFFESNGKRSYQMWTTTPDAVWNYTESGTFKITVLIRDNDNYSVVLDELIWWIEVKPKDEDKP